MAYGLRPYQEKAIKAVFREWKTGHRKTLLVQSTGTGKTVCFANIIKYFVDHGKRSLVLAHRGELLTQASEKIESITGVKSALEKAENTSIDSDSLVTVASVQTMQSDRRLSKFPSDAFDLIVVDEAHHSLSPSYQKVLNHFKGAYVLGVTATPDRGDKKKMSEYYDSCAFEYNLVDAIKEGYLCPIKAQMIPLQIDISDVGITNGDYNAGQTGDALEPYLEAIADEMIDYCKDRKTVAFLPLVSTAKKLTEILNEKGFPSAEIDGKSEDRDEILEDFEKGKYKCLNNAMLLTEGWDCPSVDCVVPLRPTKIRSLLAQEVGRGTRLFPGKKDLLILDFLWLTERHDLCRPSSLISKDADMAARIDKMIADDPDGMDLMDAEEQAERDVISEREASLMETLRELRGRKKKLVDPLQYAASVGSERLLTYEPTFAWEKEKMTLKQEELLLKRGIDPDAVETKGKAAVVITSMIERQKQGLATPKQIYTLEKNGFEHVGSWKFEDASRMISIIASNNWKVPSYIDPTKVHNTEHGLILE